MSGKVVENGVGRIRMLSTGVDIGAGGGVYGKLVDLGVCGGGLYDSFRVCVEGRFVVIWRNWSARGSGSFLRDGRTLDAKILV